MNIFRLFGKKAETPSVPVLRNKPGGWAWIKGLNDVTGEHVLNNRAVKTMAIGPHGQWIIDPPQRYISTNSGYYPHCGITVLAGRNVDVIAIGDAYLEPWKEDGIREEDVRDLYEPSGMLAKGTA